MGGIAGSSPLLGVGLDQGLGQVAISMGGEIKGAGAWL